MKEDLQLEKIINDRDALFAADWDELISLQKQYPYSHLIAQLVAKKHFLETGFLFSSHYNEALHIQNQPAQSYQSMQFWNATMKKKKDLQKKKKEKKKKIHEQPGSDSFFSGLKGEFSKWLLNKDNKIHPSKIKGFEVKHDDDVELKDAIVSESLAKIYEKQGLLNEAIEMYSKLSLKNPEKSAYFAEIIENLKKR